MSLRADILSPRAKILLALHFGASSVDDIIEETGLARTTTYNYLRIFLEAGLVEKAGESYTLTPRGRREVEKVLTHLREIVC